MPGPRANPCDPSRPASPSAKRETSFVKIAKALADPTRHKILREIRAAGHMTCSAVCDQFPLSQPTISHHIKTLEAAGLITIEKQGQFHRLTVNEEVLSEFVAELGVGTADKVPSAEPARKPHRGGT